MEQRLISPKEEPSSVSFLQLKSSLYQKFENEGVIRSLKSQLRSQVLGKLRGDRLFQALKRNREPLTIIERAVHSLVADFLHSRQYHNSLSVFLPECNANLPTDHKNGGGNFGLSFDDAVSILRLKPQKLTDDRYIVGILRNRKSSKSKLEAFLEAFSERPGHREKVENGCQTPAKLFNPEIDSVDWKLKRLEEKYRADLEKEAALPYQTMEERMQKYQRECDKRARKEIEDEIARIRSTEIIQMRTEERMRYRRELEVVQQQIEEMYKERLSDLRSKEERMSSEIKSKQKIVEDSAFQQRQRILDDMERLREREASARRAEVQNAKRAQLEEDRLAHKAMMLDRQIRDYEKARREIHESKRQAAEQARKEADKEWESKLKGTMEARVADTKLVQKMREELQGERNRFDAKQKELDAERRRVEELVASVQEQKVRVEVERKENAAHLEAREKMKQEKITLLKQLDEMRDLRLTINNMEKQAKQEREKHLHFVKNLEAKHREELGKESRAKVNAIQTLQNENRKQILEFRRKQRLWENALRGLQKRLEIKTRHESALDAQREADQLKIRSLERKLANASLRQQRQAPGMFTISQAYRPASALPQLEFLSSYDTKIGPINSKQKLSTSSQSGVPHRGKPQRPKPPQSTSDFSTSLEYGLGSSVGGESIEEENRTALLNRETEEAARLQQMFAGGAQWRQAVRGRHAWYPGTSPRDHGRSTSRRRPISTAPPSAAREETQRKNEQAQISHEGSGPPSKRGLTERNSEPIKKALEDLAPKPHVQHLPNDTSSDVKQPSVASDGLKEPSEVMQAADRGEENYPSGAPGAGLKKNTSETLRVVVERPERLPSQGSTRDVKHVDVAEEGMREGGEKRVGSITQTEIHVENKSKGDPTATMSSAAVDAEIPGRDYDPPTLSKERDAVEASSLQSSNLAKIGMGMQSKEARTVEVGSSSTPDQTATSVHVADKKEDALAIGYVQSTTESDLKIEIPKGQLNEALEQKGDNGDSEVTAKEESPESANKPSSPMSPLGDDSLELDLGDGEGLDGVEDADWMF